MIEKFAGYGFNKSHSTAYALIAYMTAYLKAHYPVEFMAALLSGDIPGRNFKKKDSLVEHMEDCRRMNIEVLPPDVNRSRRRVRRRRRQDLHVGLSAIKGCGGSGRRRRSSAARKAGGPFRSLFDFCERVDPQQVNRDGDRIAGQGRGVRFARRTPLAVDGRHRPGRASRRRGARRSPQRAKRACSTRHDDEPPNRRASATCPTCPNGTPRTAWPPKRKCWASTSRAIRWPSTNEKLTTYCSHTTVEVAGAEASHRSRARRHDRLDQALAHQESPSPAAPTPSTPCSTWRTSSGIMRCILLAGGVCQVRPSDRSRRDSGGPRCDRQAARQRGGQFHRQRVDSPWPRWPAASPAACSVRLSEAQHGSARCERTARNPARLSGQLRIATGGLPGRRPPGADEKRTNAGRPEPRNARPGRRLARAGQCPIARCPTPGPQRRRMAGIVSLPPARRRGDRSTPGVLAAPPPPAIAVARGNRSGQFCDFSPAFLAVDRLCDFS